MAIRTHTVMKAIFLFACVLLMAASASAQSTPTTSPANGPGSGNRTTSSDNPPMGGGNPPGTGVSDGNQTIMPNGQPMWRNQAGQPVPAGQGESAGNLGMGEQGAGQPAAPPAQRNQKAKRKAKSKPE